MPEDPEPDDYPENGDIFMSDEEIAAAENRIQPDQIPNYPDHLWEGIATAEDVAVDAVADDEPDEDEEAKD